MCDCHYDNMIWTWLCDINCKINFSGGDEFYKIMGMWFIRNIIFNHFYSIVKKKCQIILDHSNST